MGLQAPGLSTYDVATLYTARPHNLIVEKLIHLIIELTFTLKALFIDCNEKLFFFISKEHRRKSIWSCLYIRDSLIYLLKIHVLDVAQNFIDKL